MDSIITVLGALAAIVAAVAGIRNDYLQNRPRLEEYINDIESAKRGEGKIVFKNTGNKTAWSVTVTGPLFSPSISNVPVGGTFEIINLQSKSQIKSLSYRRKLGFKNIYLIGGPDSEIKSSGSQDRIDSILSLSGRIRLRTLLKTILKASQNNEEISFKVTEASVSQIEIESELAILKSAFSDEFSSAAFIISSLSPSVTSLTSQPRPGFEDIEDAKQRVLHFAVTREHLLKIFRNDYSIFRIFFPKRYESEYFARSNVIAGISDGLIEPLPERIKIGSSVQENLIFFSDMNPPSNSFSIKFSNKYCSNIETYISIARSRADLAAAAKFKTHVPYVTIIDKDSRVIYSTESTISAQLSQSQFDDFMSAYEAMNKTDKKRLRPNSKILLKNLITTTFWKPQFESKVVERT